MSTGVCQSMFTLAANFLKCLTIYSVSTLFQKLLHLLQYCRLFQHHIHRSQESIARMLEATSVSKHCQQGLHTLNADKSRKVKQVTKQKKL